MAARRGYLVEGLDRGVVITAGDGKACHAERCRDDAVVGEPQVVIVLRRNVIHVGDAVHGALGRFVLVREPAPDELGGTRHRELRGDLARHCLQHCIEPAVRQFRLVVHQRADSHVPLHAPRIAVLHRHITEQFECCVDVVEFEVRPRFGEVDLQ
ncbi:Uncharacterised protein [Mycobacteroides abscessus subsp. abscessus]|nr:Uncharacterised protein [Mycobacteroides abscessus subsp. abscessus]